MVFIPHGLDQMFGTFRSSPTSEILPAMQGLVAQAVLSTLPGRQQYLERMGMLRDECIPGGKAHELGARVGAKIGPHWRPTALTSPASTIRAWPTSTGASWNGLKASEQLSSMQSGDAPGFDFDVELRELQGLPSRATTRREPMGRN